MKKGYSFRLLQNVFKAKTETIKTKKRTNNWEKRKNFIKNLSSFVRSTKPKVVSNLALVSILTVRT